ncbi:hypothetical protein CCY01nite_36860 [Chitinophaga cymbidii]|uniref:Fimbrillin-A associated anchor s Mfa1 and Mfa2 family protein n=2 Tax=Chitinophaga cymbidii TaxID=1096750 RepID=A0A512RP06_9BACT|nr:hypothetical protein CCY01nite_36860 [Chitinophaga cymbidii]
MVDLPEGEYDISVIAFKRGSGPGLYYEWKDGVPYYGEPINSSLTNSMYGPNRIQMRDSLYSMQLFDPQDSTKSLPLKFIAEVDGYHGRKVVAVNGTPSVVTLEMKRMAFGVQLSADNFTEGKLHAEFIGNGAMLPKTVTPENMGGHFIYTLHSFIGQEDTYSRLLNVRITWEKADGTMVPLGEKPVYFKRNILTTIHVTIPGPDEGTILDPVIIESEWVKIETEEF